MNRGLPGRVLVADDHALFRDGLKLLLTELNAAMDVTEAEDYPGALSAVQRGADFDLALIDLGMPGMDRFAGLRALKTALNGKPVVVVSGSETADEMAQAMDCGAAGYIPKTMATTVMIEAVKKVMAGELYLPPGLAGWQPGSAPVAGKGARLTPRQADVLDLMAAGQSNKQIARTLGLAEGTVKLHVTGLLRVLDATNRTEAVIKAASLGLTTAAGH